MLKRIINAGLSGIFFIFFLFLFSEEIINNYKKALAWLLIYVITYIIIESIFRKLGLLKDKKTG